MTSAPPKTPLADADVGRSSAPLRRLARAITPTAARAHFRIAQWRLRGGPVPPPHYYKQQVVKKTAREYRLKDLVETGTFLGDMLAATRNSFDSLTSIELSEELHNRAKQRFVGDDKIILLQGDSKDRIAEVAAALDRPALFWLDAHYSGAWHEDFEETAGVGRDKPIYTELGAILAKGIGHVVLIDDARLFNGREGWPRLDDVLAFVEEREPDRRTLVADDIIRILPR
jgi:hypothetical protein